MSRRFSKVSAARKSAGDPVDQRFLVDDELDDVIDLAAAVGEPDFQRGGLVAGAREAVEDRARAARRVEPLADQRRDDGVTDEFTRFHHRLGLEAGRRPLGHRLAEHVAGRQLDHAARVDQALRLGALAGARRSQQDDVHVPAPHP